MLMDDYSALSPIFPKDNFRIFKFIPHRWMEAFFATGSLRIGTTDDFADDISYDEARGDKDEGRFRSSLILDDYLSGTDDRDNYLEQFLGKLGENVRIKGIKFRMTHAARASYVFCTSAYFTEELFKQWNKNHSETDCCYEIFDSAGFIRAINDQMSRYIRFYTAAHIKYINGELPHDSENIKWPPVFIKRSEYAWQVEARAVWQPVGPYTKIDALNMVVPNARRYCRPFARLDNGSVTYF